MNIAEEIAGSCSIRIRPDANVRSNGAKKCSLHRPKDRIRSPLSEPLSGLQARPVPEIVLELSLNRSSGILAGIVASLARTGIELKNQKLQRAADGCGGWLTIIGSGDPPEPGFLAERLNESRGVEQLMRMVVDGEV